MRDDFLDFLACEVEKKEKRESRKQRKRMSLQDRSQFKWTDRKKLAPQSGFEKAALGRVISVQPKISVAYEGTVLACVLPGRFKNQKSHLKTPIVVGDWVRFDPSKGLVLAIEPRSNAFSRADNLSRKREQVIAANVDRVFIVTSLALPSFKPALVDRYLIAAKKGGVMPCLVVNKCDLLDTCVEEERAHFFEYQRVCSSVGIPLIVASVKTGEGKEELFRMMQDSVSLFSGQSGAGKTSLINLVADLSLETGEMRLKTKKGSHTTTAASLIAMPFGGYCVDTPGIQSFGIWDLEREEICGHFSEIERCGRECRFSDCLHMDEPGCVISDCVQQGEISPLRLASYRCLMQEADELHRRR